MDGGEGANILLYGATGSGKTEVYLQACAAALERGLGAIVLVPEIALTPQARRPLPRPLRRQRRAPPLGPLRRRAARRARADRERRGARRRRRALGGLRAGARARADRRRRGARRLVQAGLRSALRRAHRRREAGLARGRRRRLRQRDAAPGELGGARAARARRPARRRAAAGARDRPPPRGRLPALRAAAARARARLGAGRQGDPAPQPPRDRARAPLPRLRDDAALQALRRLARPPRRRAPPLPPLRLRRGRARRTCPACGSAELARLGAGTQRLERELAAALPELVPIRLDADTAAVPGALSEALARFDATDRAVLVGTQMVAKGHHFSGVALAAVVDADTGLGAAGLPRRGAHLPARSPSSPGAAAATRPGGCWSRPSSPTRARSSSPRATTSRASSRASSSGGESSATRRSATSCASSSRGPTRRPSSARSSSSAAASTAPSCSARRRCSACAAATAPSSSPRRRARAPSPRAPGVSSRPRPRDAPGGPDGGRRCRSAEPLTVRRLRADVRGRRARSARTSSTQPARARRRLALAQIRQYGDPALRMTAREVETFDEDLERLAERMIALMHDASGVGLAATQVGVLQRVFVVEPDDEEPRALVNPHIVERSAETAVDDEGCLSLQGVLVPVERHVEGHGRGARRPRRARPARARGARRPRRPARARPPRRDADHRPDRSGEPPRRPRDAAAEARPLRLAWLGSPSRRRRRSARTCSSGWRRTTRSPRVLTRPDRPAGRGRHETPPPAKLAAERLGIPVLQPERLEPGARPRRAGGRRRGLRRADPARGARGPALAERPSVAAAALARRGAGRARDHGRRRGDRRDDPRDRRGARRRPDRRAASVPDRPRGRRGSGLRARRRGRGRAARRGARRRAGFTPQPEDGVTYAEKITAADRELDWSRPPQELLDRIRALSPHIGARGELDGRRGHDLARAARGREARPARGAAGGPAADELRRVPPRPADERRPGPASRPTRSCAACSRRRPTPTGCSAARSRASTRATARSRSGSPTAPCSACARSTTRSRRSAGGRCAKLDPPVRTALRLGAYQLGYLDSVPRHAAVNESVELVRRAGLERAVPFANAVMRRLALELADMLAALPEGTPERGRAQALLSRLGRRDLVARARRRTRRSR